MISSEITSFFCEETCLAGWGPHSPVVEETCLAGWGPRYNMSCYGNLGTGDNPKNVKIILFVYRGLSKFLSIGEF